MRTPLWLTWVLLALGMAQSEVPVRLLALTSREEGGFFKVLGELRNPHPEPLCFVQADLRYLDAKGQPIEVERFTAREAGWMPSDAVMAERGVLPPGETTPFLRSRDLAKLRARPVKIEVRAAGLRLRSLETRASIGGFVARREGSFFRLTGFYTASGKPAMSPKVVAAIYDQSGAIQNVASFFLTSDGTPRGEPLRQATPGQRYTFNLLLAAPVGSMREARAWPSWACE